MSFTPTRPRVLAPVIALFVLAACSASSARAQEPAGTCTKYGAPNGSDAGTGTLTAPYRSVQKLASALQPGQTGCLRAGTYEAPEALIAKGGSEAAPLTLTSYPGERARILGRVIIRDGANWVVLRDLDLDGSTAGLCPSTATCHRHPSPTIIGDHARLEGNDITNQHQAICVLLGVPGYGRAEGTVIRGNRIHDCGVLPARNYDHGIYVSEADDTVIVDNVIFDNSDRGVQLYPDAQRTTVRGNVIDGNGEGVLFSGAQGEVSNDNVVENNLITNSNQRNNVESWYPSGNPIGQRNVLRNNCIHGGVRDDGDGGLGVVHGFEAHDNLFVDPQYVDRSAKDFRLRDGSPCAGLLSGTAPTLASGSPQVGSSPPAASGPAPTGPGDGSDGSGTTSGTGSGPAPVVIVTKSRKRRKVRVRGRVRARRAGIASASRARRATIQMRFARGWRPVARPRMRDHRFTRRLSLPRGFAGRVVTLRALVPDVGASKRARTRVKR
jgi:parallel beta-helix repeat protein